MLAVVVLDEWHGAMDRQKSVAAVVVIETGSIDCYAAPAVAMVLIAGVVSDAVPVGPSAIGEVVAVMAEAVVETESVVLVVLPPAAAVVAAAAVEAAPSQCWQKLTNLFHRIDWDLMSRTPCLRQRQQSEQISQLDSN